MSCAPINFKIKEHDKKLAHPMMSFAGKDSNLSLMNFWVKFIKWGWEKKWENLKIAFGE
jgi:hypothetical protein